MDNITDRIDDYMLTTDGITGKLIDILQDSKKTIEDLIQEVEQYRYRLGLRSTYVEGD